MLPKRPVHPILIVLPVAAFTLTVGALVAHAVTGDDAWYRGALFADLGGLVLSVVTMVAALLDAVTLPRFTVARIASWRQAAFTVAGLILFAATATAIFNRYETHRALGDTVPLVLAGIGLFAIAIAGWYGRAVQLAFGLDYTIVRYPQRMLARPTVRRPPGSARTLV